MRVSGNTRRVWGSSPFGWRTEQSKYPLIVAVVGPTASGKTALAKFLADALNGAVISVDSVQVYQGADIGSAKDTSFPQQLVDIADPANEIIDASKMQQLVYTEIERGVKIGKLPILVGGTGMYLDAIFKGYDFPAGKTHKGQFRHRATPPPYRFLIVGVEVPRDELYSRIEERAKKMVKNGLIAEVTRLSKVVPVDHPLWRAIGYRQVKEMANGKGKMEKGRLLEEIVRATKVFVRRQFNWLKRWEVNWVGSKDEALKLVKSALRE